MKKAIDSLMRRIAGSTKTTELPAAPVPRATWTAPPLANNSRRGLPADYSRGVRHSDDVPSLGETTKV